MSSRVRAGLPCWMASGACVRADPELFFPASPGTVGHREAEGAKAVCARCLVRGECLAYALATRQKYGVWGGATEEERRLMTRRNHRGAIRHHAGARGG